MIQRIKDYLQAFGITVGEEEDILLTVIYENCERKILALANLGELPDGLMSLLERMVVGEYIRHKWAFNALQSDVITFEKGLKSLQMGDTNITYTDDDSQEKRLQRLIDSLCYVDLNEVYRFRKLRW